MSNVAQRFSAPEGIRRYSKLCCVSPRYLVEILAGGTRNSHAVQDFFSSSAMQGDMNERPMKLRLHNTLRYSIARLYFIQRIRSPLQYLPNSAVVNTVFVNRWSGQPPDSCISKLAQMVQHTSWVIMNTSEARDGARGADWKVKKLGSLYAQ